MPTITAMFDNRADATAARDRLAGLGIDAGRVGLHDSSSIGDRATGRDSASPDTGDDISDGRDGTHRNIIGDYIDNRTGEKLMSDAGSDRDVLGNFVGTDDHAGHDHAGHDHAGHDHTPASQPEPGLWDRIKAFFGDDHALYEEGMRRGGQVLTVRVGDAEADRVTTVLEDAGAVDIGEREAGWRNDGWSGGGQTDTLQTGTRVRSYTGEYRGL